MPRDSEVQARQKVVVEVGGRRIEVSLPGDLALATGAPGDLVSSAVKPKARKRGSHAGANARVGRCRVTAPMQGTVVKVAVEEAASRCRRAT